MKFNIITIFPQVLDAYFNESILKRAQEKNIVQINSLNLRDWTFDKHHSVDDTPYGGGAGMVMRVDVIHAALKDIVSNQGAKKTILLSAKGKKWDQQLAKKYSKLEEVNIICGRYEGVDERVTKFIDDEISIGDYVLTGGEIGAMVIVDSVTRLLPGVLGNKVSLESESHNKPGQLEYAQYTRPEIFVADEKKYRVPKVLLSGNHKEIEEWKTSKKK
ncbi:tRNA (guanosine(37)-N1)-methyltransferase TrmD [Patescibacteria group bacterium]|nr:tRNA (guanosine(37)-N1)-methyltransferase TrmD [Patescibacteria group bacterium]